MAGVFRAQRSGLNAVFGGIFTNSSTGFPDTQNPVIPGTLIVSGVTSAGFTVSWNAGTDNVGVVGYDVSVDTGTTTYQSVGPVLTYVAAGLNPSTQYTVRVRAYDAANNKSVALTAAVTTAAGIDSITPVWANGATVAITLSTANGFTVSWPAATDNIGVVSYDLSVDTGVPNFVSVGAARIKAVTGLVSGTTYTVRVTAVDAAGNRSAAITTTTATTGDPPVGVDVGTVVKTLDSVAVLKLSKMSIVPTVLNYKAGTSQELVLFNNGDSTATVTLKGSAAGAVTTKGLAGVTVDLSSGLPINLPSKQFVTLKLDNAALYMKGIVTLTTAAADIFVGVLQ